jgi:transcriptional regulator with XRE-family HTH domain
MQPKELRSRRLALGWPASRLAAALGVRSEDVYAWEAGERPIDSPRAVDQILSEGVSKDEGEGALKRRDLSR